MPRTYEPVYGEHATRRRVDKHRVHQVEQLAAQGFGLAAIVRAMRGDVSRTTVRRYLANIELCGSAKVISRDDYLPTGPSRTLTMEMELRLLDYLYDRPTAYLDEVGVFLLDEFDLDVSVWTIGRALQRHRWSRKAAQRVAKQRNPILRAEWALRSALYTADQIVCVDETASADRTGYRKYGWSRLGDPCVDRRSLKHTKRFSVLPGYTIDGWLPDPLICEGGVKKEEFVEFVRTRILPYMNAFPFEKSVLVMDNCEIHMSLELEQLCAEKGVKLELLPPYSPDYNPIELSFSVLKGWIRRHMANQISMFPTFEAFLVYAIQHSDCDRYAVQHFRHCGYRFKGDIPLYVEGDEYDL